jgi:hypothetical protein
VKIAEPPAPIELMGSSVLGENPDVKATDACVASHSLRWCEKVAADSLAAVLG